MRFVTTAAVCQHRPGRSHRLAPLVFHAVGGELLQQRRECPGTSMTFFALSSSPASRWLSFFSRATSRSRGSVAWRPAGRAGASTAPRSRCLRHSARSDEYSPSRRSSIPLSTFPRVSYSARIFALYFAGNRRGPRANNATGPCTVSRPATPSERCCGCSLRLI